MQVSTPDKLYRRVFDAVLAQIQAGEYKIGDRLPAEREHAERHEVSRTTVREAMVGLEMLGFVEMRKGAGIFVVNDSMATGGMPDLNIGAFELIEARRLIESEIAGLAALYATAHHIEELELCIKGMHSPDEVTAEIADRQFHLIIARAAGNSALVATVEHLWDMRERAPLARVILHGARGLGMASRIDEHMVVLDAIRAKDPSAAKAGMAAHLERVIEHLLVTTEQHEIAIAKERSSALRKRVTQAAV